VAFSRTRRIRFSDCDPAGIVFYPQYFVLFNDLLEEWIDSSWDGGFVDFVVCHRFGVPTVRLEADFKSISRMGDDVILSLNVVRIGQRSFELALDCTGATDGVLRMSARQTLVTTSLETHRATPIPPPLRQALAHLAPAATARVGASAP
jgi:4-hydroxybenzoyl-CoA thioesterase